MRVTFRVMVRVKNGVAVVKGFGVRSWFPLLIQWRGGYTDISPRIFLSCLYFYILVLTLEGFLFLQLN